jgi:hypothetical protein
MPLMLAQPGCFVAISKHLYLSLGRLRKKKKTALFLLY